MHMRLEEAHVRYRSGPLASKAGTANWTWMSARQTRIVMFAKAPIPGEVKTRLIPVLGPAGAAQLARQMLEHTMAEAVDAGIGVPELCAEPDPTSEVWRPFLSRDVRLASQGGGDLGERLARAAQRVISAGENILLIGTDCPGLTALHMRSAASDLRTSDAIIHPAIDGGYVLLGLRRFHPTIFENMPWSTKDVGRMTRDRIAALGWTLEIGETLADIDEPDDLRRLPKAR